MNVWRRTRLLPGAALVAALATAACGDDSPSAPGPTVTAITVQVQTGSTTPTEGEVVRLGAIATFSDGTTGDITSTASWSSASPNVSVAGNEVQARAAGAATVAASRDGVQGTTQLNVQPAPVIRQETVSLPATDSFDFDAGAINPAEGRDIWYNAETETALFLDVAGANAAPTARAGTTQPGRGGCVFASGYSTTRLPFASLAAGEYLCVRTNGGGYAELRLDSVPASYLGPLVFTYRLFSAP